MLHFLYFLDFKNVRYFDIFEIFHIFEFLNFLQMRKTKDFESDLVLLNFHFADYESNICQNMKNMDISQKH